MRKLIAIIPTLNEQKGLPFVIRELKAGGADGVVVVDGHSTDSTVRVAKQLGASVIFQKGRGKGMAFRTFVRKYPIRSDDFYVMIDGDASYSGHEISKFRSALERSDVVFGNRGILVHDVRSLIHVLGGLAISLFGSLLFLRYNPDICSGYVGFRGNALKKLALRSRTFTLEANIFAESAKKGLSMSLVSVSYRRREGVSKLTLFDGPKIVLALLRERFL